MPYLPTSAAWFTQSALLLEARPHTTRITTKYTILNPEKSKPRPAPKDSTGPDSSTNTTAAATATQSVKGHLTLKTYDPTSGTCLKYRTDKAAEVGRLIASLGKLGKGMAGLGVPIEEDAVMADAKDEAYVEAGTSTPLADVVDSKKTGDTSAKGQPGGGKKKKKGKR